jgi:hypothetical protein
MSPVACLSLPYQTVLMAGEDLSLFHAVHSVKNFGGKIPD